MKEENNELRDWFLNEIAKIDITGNKQNQNVKWQDKWQKLKEWFREKIKEYEPTYNEWMARNLDFYSKTKTQSIYKIVLDKMQELEGEDVEGLIEDRNKTIKFLQNELAEKTAKLEFANKEIERLKASNCYIHDLHNNLYREYQKKNDELYKNQTQLDQANERLKGAIVPKFKVGQECYYVYTKSQLRPFNVKIGRITFDTDKKNKIMYDSDFEDDDSYFEKYYGMKECNLFATEQEAQAKLKEIQGNE